ncbi:DNRLRE domain-containing protein [Streptomyces peucetius]|uniref:DNRLRE domain-containing protein n=1 Tax=Streptomyces peucetius TaxID=1950 RepID=A0ABY6IGX6_STRPE|nr:DNRLRE domain-containing protein [Streptomyces peucetius]UYQ65102.1 DNRLRE domain-containing protein [Streptomyces peucetius]
MSTAMVLAAETGLVLSGTGQAVALAAVPAQPVNASKPAGTGPSQAADIPSAKVAARLYGKRVEALSERTEASTTWVNKDGSLTTELSAGPIRFQRDGQWVDVDVRLQAGSSGSVEAKAHPHGLKLAGRTGTRAASLRAAQDAAAVDLVTLGSGEEQITLQWKGGLPKPELTGSRAVYPEAVPGADVVVEATRTGFEQFVEIKKRPASDGYTYTLPLKTKGLKAKQQADGSVLFTDKKTKNRLVMPAPVMWDSTVDPVSGEHTRRVPVSMKVKQRGTSVDLVVTPDAEFLSDPKTKYPVTVDPSTSSLSNVFDTYVQQGETRDWSTDTELDLGNPGTTNPDGTPRIAQSFISWNTTPVQDALISSAKLSLWNFHSGNVDCKPYPWEVWSSGAASTSSRWTNRPTMTAKKATSTETRGNSACTTAPDGWINADVTTLVQEWASAKATRGHMGLRASSESVVAQWKRVNSANAASNPPRLVVNYNYRPRSGTNQEAGPPFFTYGGAYMVNTVTPTLRDTFVDPDGDKVNGTFQIFDSATNTQVGNVLVSPYVPSGQQASVTVPAGVLAEGKTYKFRTSPYDGTHYNTGWSAWKTFTVDSKAPSAPARITSADYPADAWVKGAGQTGTFTVTPAAADHNWLEWSLDGVTWTKVATGGATADKAISVTPSKNGTQTLQVRSVDKADNSSEPLDYTFHVGPGGILQPSEGERTARRLPLVAEAEAGKYDKVSFSWRRSDADAWAPVPTAHVTAAGQPLASWPVPLVDGKNAGLVWAATETVDPDGSIQLKADFTGPDAAASSTPPLSVVVDRNAEGAESTGIGPGHLNLLTGDFRLTGTEQSYFDLSASRTASSRRPTAATAQEGQAPIFGKEWLSGTLAEVSQAGYTHIRRTSATSLDVVMEDGTKIHFTARANTPGGWVPEPGSEMLTLTGTFAGGFTLIDTEGAESVFAKVDSAAETWQITSSRLQGIENSTTNMISEPVVVGTKTLARPRMLISSHGAVANSTCAKTPSTRGCRVLEFVYATSTTGTDATPGDFSGQLKALKLWSTEAGASAATAKTVQSYAYDAAGRLREAWNPLITPALKTKYAYDSAGRVTQVTAPGQLPWTMTYGNAGGTAGGDGMLTSVTRATLKQGTKSTTDGQAVTSVVYNVPITGADAPHAMGASDVKAWGQLDAPSDATAIFPPDSVPPTYKGGALGADGYRRAELHYLDASGREVNTVDEAGGITTTEYDLHGNVIRELSAGNRALALGKTDEEKARLSDLGIALHSTAERAALLSGTSLYNSTGTRLLEQFGPLRRVDLTEDFKDGTTVLIPAGTSVAAQPWTVTEYDEGRPTDGSAVAKDQPTLSIVGARVRGHYSVMGEKRLTETQYDWAKGLPVLTIEDPGGLNLTTSTAYDAQGRITAVVPPGGTGQDATSRIVQYWSATGTGWCEGRPEWVGLECWAGPAGAITGGGSQPTEVVDTTTEYEFFGQPTEKTETANGVTRTTTTVFDGAGRVKSVQVDGGVGKVVAGTSLTYDPLNGSVIKTASADGGSILQEYDDLGRVISYTDADNGVTTTEYDAFDRPVKVSDSVPSTTTYTYDHTAEPRGLPTAMNDSVAGTFRATYDTDGGVVSQSLPGGYTMTQSAGKIGMPYQRLYTRDSDGTVLLSDSVAETIHGEWSHHAGGAGMGEAQDFTYDRIGRLTKVADTYNGACTSRTYGFDKRTNRTSLTTAVGAPGAECPTSGGETVTSAYDSADRQVDPGYTYDAFGRTTRLPDGTTIAYHNNDLVQQQTVGNSRQTWSLDASGRIRGWTTESNTAGSWNPTGTKTNHYGDSSDNPRWITDSNGSGVVRMVGDLASAMSATTGKSGEVSLQLSNLHGDINLVLPLDTALAPTALSSDEYGNQRMPEAPVRYGWLGSMQRSAQTPGGTVLMGVRLYNPATGRFLSVDPVLGGSRNSYEYAAANPVTNTDLDGRKYRKRTRYYSWGRVVLEDWSKKYTYKTWWGSKYTRTAYSGRITVHFNKTWTRRVANNLDWVYNPLAIAAAAIPKVGWLIAVAIWLYGTWVHKTAQKARANGRCLAVKTWATGYKWYTTYGNRPYQARC